MSVSPHYFRPKPDVTHPNPIDELTDDQREKLATLRDRVLSWESASATPGNIAYLSNELIYYRFLMGLDWDLEVASKQMEDTCEWRAEYKPELVTPPDLAEFMTDIAEPMFYHHGWDKEGHPVIYIHLAQSTKITDIEHGVRLQVCHLEEIYRECFPENLFRYRLVVDVSGISLWSVGTLVKAFNSMGKPMRQLGDRYAEALLQAIVVNSGVFIRALNSVAKLFMEKRTQEKFLVHSDMSHLPEYIDPSELPDHFGGTSGFDYVFADHVAAWEAREERRRREDGDEGEAEGEEEVVYVDEDGQVIDKDELDGEEYVFEEVVEEEDV